MLTPTLHWHISFTTVVRVVIEATQGVVDLLSVREGRLLLQDYVVG